MSAPTSVPREQLLAFLGETLLIRRFEENVTGPLEVFEGNKASWTR
jgi:hypothetical protein